MRWELDRRDVIIVQRRLTHYRVPLFEKLRGILRQQGLGLRLLIGEPTDSELAKKDGAALDWAIRLPTHYALDGHLCWQPFGRHLDGAAIVIITQENRLLYNHCLLFKRPECKLAFWGHGANLQAVNPDCIRERFKRWTTNRVDWWFAYTPMSVELVERCGFPTERITNLENTIDTKALRDQCESVSDAELFDHRQRLGLVGAKVGIFLGSLYEEKRIDFLLEAGELLASILPEFRLLIVGDGPKREVVERATAGFGWLKYLGGKSGRDKAVLLRLADAFMNPGLVGLGILDTFVSGVPMITTDCHLHSPEIAYLRSGDNGVMTRNTLEDYVDTVRSVLCDDVLQMRLKQGAMRSSHQYTIENMANNFTSGILRAIGK